MAAHLQNNQLDKFLYLFRDMIFSGTRPNEFSMSILFKACGISKDAFLGKMAHGFSIKTGLEERIVVGNSISHMYSKFGLIENAKKMFEVMPERNLVSWNAMIAGLVLEGDGISALRMFDEMRSIEEDHPDEFTFSSLLKACSGLSFALSGAQIHAIIITGGYQNFESLILPGALIDLYVKCGKISEAKKVFDLAENKNAIFWTALVAGYSEEGLLKEAMEIFSQIRNLGVQIDGFLLSALIGIFADLALINQGKQVHAISVKLPFGSEVSVANSILDMYFKCGIPEEASQFFGEMKFKNLISWTAAINGFGRNGKIVESVFLFSQMEEQGVFPDGVTYLAVLSACSHTGNSNFGRIFYSKLLKDERIKLRPEHHSCMIDLLGREGKLEEARKVIQRVESTAATWQTLLSACRLHSNVKIGREVLGILGNLEGETSANYVMMANMLADDGKWEECEDVWEMMGKKRIKKEGGCSWIEVEKQVHSFYRGDESHPRIEEVKGMIEGLDRRMMVGESTRMELVGI